MSKDNDEGDDGPMKMKLNMHKLHLVCWILMLILLLITMRVPYPILNPHPITLIQLQQRIFKLFLVFKGLGVLRFCFNQAWSESTRQDWMKWLESLCEGCHVKMKLFMLE